MKRALTFFTTILLCCLMTEATLATNPKQPYIPLTPKAPAVGSQAYVIMDANSGEVLAEKHANDKASPASLTKMMTVYVVFHALKNHQININDEVRISKKAWKMSGSRMFVEPRHKVSIEKLLQGAIVSSGNDACVALAEHVAGSETGFTDLMNQSAQYLGMKNTHFTDSTGLPHPDHYSTPYDLAILASHIINDYPEYYHYFKQKKLTYNHITQSNRNLLLWRNPNVDGLKTGHTETAGYCLVSSAVKDGQRLIVVVLGAKSEASRAQDSQSLLTWGFRFFQTIPLYTTNTAVKEIRVWGGSKGKLAIGSTHNVAVTIPKGQEKQMKTTISMNNKTVRAPVEKGTTIATATVTLDGKTLRTVPLVALTNEPRGGMFTRIYDQIAMHVHNWFH